MTRDLTRRAMSGAVILLLCGVTVSGCAISRPASTSTLAWYAGCGADKRGPIFTLDLLPSGDVIYRGGERAQVVGERRAHADQGPINAIRKRLAVAIRESRRPTHGNGPPLGGPEVCIESTSDHSEAGPNWLSSRGRETRQLIDLINQTIEPRQWACPNRSVPGHPLLNWGYCGRPRVLFVYRQDAACGVADVVQIYADGALLHAVESGAGEERQPYMTHIDNTALEKTLALMRTFTPTEIGEAFGVPRVRDGVLQAAVTTPFVQYREPRQLETLRNFISTLAPVPWASASAEPGRCAHASNDPVPHAEIVTPFLNGTWSRTYYNADDEQTQ